MSSFSWSLVLFTPFLVATAVTDYVKPIEKVITLLEDLKKEVVADGKSEASTYDKFACWCKDETKTQSDTTLKSADDIDTLSASIAEKTASKVLKQSEVKQLKADKESTEKELQNATATYDKQKAEYDIEAADMTKAITSLTGAISAMESKKTQIDQVSFAQLHKTVAESLALADAMSLISAPKRQAISAFLQQKVDPADPTYKYHSTDIVKLLKDLHTQFTNEKKELDDDWDTTHKAYVALKGSLESKISSLEDEIKTGESRIDTLTSEIASARSDLVIAEDTLKEAQLYLKDMTAKCESTARDWDQQSQLRADEVTALTGALDVLKNKVQPAEVVNVRALLQAKPATVKTAARVLQAAKPHFDKAAALASSNASRPISFVQTRRTSVFLEARRAGAQERSDRAVAILQKAGKQLGSPVLSALAMQIAADPFKKVKELIQKLIERLVAESTAEATKKGYCDTELGKAKKERDFRMTEARKLNVEASALEVKIDELTQEIESLRDVKIPDMDKALSHATTIRANEKSANNETITTAEGGLTAVTEAITILKDFYKKAAKATVLLQKASPIDEKVKEIGATEGAYKGKQEASVAIIALLEQIKDDFERTIRKTTTEERQAAADFIEFERTAKSQLSGWETKLALDEQDLESTKTDLEKTMDDMQTAVSLLDGALKTLELLKPTCIDTGMTYKERTGKREEEIAALKQALCALDSEKVEVECQ